jgi:integrase
MYHKHGAYYLVRNGKWRRLGTELAPSLHEYARLLCQADGTMPALIETMLPRILRNKKNGAMHAESTQKQYRQAASVLAQMLAPLSVQDVSPRDVKAVRRELQDTPAVANRTVTVLKLILQEAVDDELIPSNPAGGIKQPKLAARTRRLTDAEFRRIYAHADPLLRAVMSLCYATGQRVMDVASIRSEDISDQGVYVKAQKTGKEVVIAWTSDLRAAVAEARALKPNALRPTHLWGFAPLTYPMIYKRWRMARVAAQVADARIHDIRAMAATDARAQGIDPQALLGHTDAATTRIYLRDRVVPVVAGPVMRRPKRA